MQVRSLYRSLLRAHPRPFRDRFEAEMLLVFDDATGLRRELLLVYDAMLSLFRQWVMRRPSSTVPTANPAVLGHGIPAFTFIDDVRTRPMALVCGGLLSFVTFAAVISASQSGNHSTFRYGFVGTGLVHSGWEWATVDTDLMETPAGQRLSQWLDAYNTGDAATMRHFVSLHVVRHPGDPAESGDYVGVWMKAFQRFGRFQLHSVHQSQSNQIISVVRNGNGEWSWIHLSIGSDDRNSVRELKVQSLAGTWR